jgi:hypothetical protein
MISSLFNLLGQIKVLFYEQSQRTNGRTQLCAFRSRHQFLDDLVDGIFRDVDFAVIEYASLSSRGILYLVEIENGATEHVRKDFIALCGGDHSSFPYFKQVKLDCLLRNLAFIATRRAPARSLSLEAFGPHKMAATAQTSGA